MSFGISFNQVILKVLHQLKVVIDMYHLSSTIVNLLDYYHVISYEWQYTSTHFKLAHTFRGSNFDVWRES